MSLADCPAVGGKPYPIPAGASDHPPGGHGFADWAAEVASSTAASPPAPGCCMRTWAGSRR